MSAFKKYLQKNTTKLLLGASGVYLAYLNLSVINQKIYSYAYPTKKDPQVKHIYEYADLVQMIAALFCLIYSFSVTKIKQESPNPIPLTQVIILGTLYTLNVNTLNYSLYYIPYPVRVVGDKMGYLTAVIIAVFFSRIKNNRKLNLGKDKIQRALMISAGAIGFAYFYQFKSSQANLYIESERWKGYVLIGISVITQALFGDSQAYAKATFKPTSNHMMFSVNLTTFFLNIFILILSGTFMPAINFCLTHQQIIVDILLVGFLTILGQVSIYYVILNFRQHMFPLVATTRKILTILYSIYYFKHKTNIQMWICLVLVFGGIIYELVDELYYDISGQKPIKVLKGINEKLSLGTPNPEHKVD